MLCIVLYYLADFNICVVFYEQARIEKKQKQVQEAQLVELVKVKHQLEHQLAAAQAVLLEKDAELLERKRSDHTTAFGVTLSGDSNRKKKRSEEGSASLKVKRVRTVHAVMERVFPSRQEGLELVMKNAGMAMVSVDDLV